MKNYTNVKLLCFLLAFVIFVGSSIDVLGSTLNSAITVTTKTIKEDTEQFKCNLNLPRIQSKTESVLDKNINDEIFCFANNLKEKFENDSKEYAQIASKKGFPIRPYVLSSEYHIPYNQNNLLSIKNVFYEYTAGAHGYYYFSTYTLDFNNEKKLTLKDLFNNGYDYNTIILSEVMNQISLHSELYFPEYIQDIGKLPTSYRFYIEPGYLVIYYDLYEIAPYASGIPEFKIPISLFGENIKLSL